MNRSLFSEMYKAAVSMSKSALYGSEEIKSVEIQLKTRDGETYAVTTVKWNTEYEIKGIDNVTLLSDWIEIDRLGYMHIIPYDEIASIHNTCKRRKRE